MTKSDARRGGAAALFGLTALCGLIACGGGQKQVKKTPTTQAAVGTPTVAAAQLTGGNLKKGVFTVIVEVPNTGNVPIKVTSVDVKANFAERGEGSGQQSPELLIPAGGSDRLRVPVTVPYGEDAASRQSLIASKTADFTASGSVTWAPEGGGAGGTTSFTGQVKTQMPAMPRAYLRLAQAARFGNEAVEVTFELAVGNINNFAVNSNGLDFKIEIFGKQYDEGTVAMGEPVLPGADLVYEQVVKLNAGTVEGNFREILKEGRFPYKITGKLDAEGFEIPLDEEGEVVLSGVGDSEGGG